MGVAHPPAHTPCKEVYTCTPNYHACTGQAADRQSCAGVCLFVMVAGTLPFEEASLGLLFRKVSRAEYTCPPWFSPDLAHTLSLCLEPDVRRR